MMVIPQFGTVVAQRLLISFSAGAALVALVPLFMPAPKSLPFSWAPRITGATALAVGLGVALWLAATVTPVPWGMVAYGRQMASWPEPLVPGITHENDIPFGTSAQDVYCTYVGEGMNVSVAVTLTPGGVRSFHGAGKVQASTLPADMRLQRMLGHLSALLNKKPEKVLVVACGAGVTAGTFVLHPDVKRGRDLRHRAARAHHRDSHVWPGELPCR